MAIADIASLPFQLVDHLGWVIGLLKACTCHSRSQPVPSATPSLEPGVPCFSQMPVPAVQCSQGLFPRGYSGGVVKLMTCLDLVPRVRMMGLVSWWYSHDRLVPIGSPYLLGWFV